MSNAERFLVAFQAIEGNLRERAGDQGHGHPSFPELVRASRGALPKSLALDLRELSELRNAIVHGTNGRVMAQPTDEAVREIEHIRRLLVDPPRVVEVIGRRTVVTTTPDATLADALREMRSGGYAQLPVYDEGRFVALLTSRTVTRWLGDTTANGQSFGLDQVTVADALAHDGASNDHRFLAASATVLDALDAFDRSRRESRELDAIIITESGRTTNKPLNIVTVHDIPRLVDALYRHDRDPGPARTDDSPS